MTTRIEQKRARMRAIVQRLVDYMQTYDTQYCYEDYEDTTFIDDVLYGLGIAIDPEQFRMADGFKKFKYELIKHIDRDPSFIVPLDRTKQPHPNQQRVAE